MRNLAIASVVGMSFCSLMAADVCVGTAETKPVRVESDSQQTDAVGMAPRSTLRKIGAGNLTLPTSKLRGPIDSVIAVGEGRLTLRRDAAPSSFDVSAGEAIIRSKAASWFVASNADSLVRDSEGNITAWLDNRETGNAESGYAFARAITDLTCTNLYPVVQVIDNHTALYFHGYPSGCWMNFVTPADKQVTYYAYNVFAVSRQDKAAALFGVRQGIHGASSLAFVCGDAAGGFKPLFLQAAQDVPAIHNARVYIDGEEVDPFNDGIQVFPKSTFCLLDAEMREGVGAVQCFFNDRDYTNRQDLRAKGWLYSAYAGVQRTGGDYICEVAVFTNELLTATERLQVEAYLQQKNFGVQRPGKVTVKTASGTELEQVATDDAEDIAVSAVGSGNLVKSGAGFADYGYFSEASGFDGGVRLDAGSLRMRASRPFAARAGETITAAQTLDGATKSVSAGKIGVFVKAGNGSLRVAEIPSDVERVQVSAGELVLDVPRTSDGTCSAEKNVVTGIVPNASFELGIGATTKYVSVYASGFQGWFSDAASAQQVVVSHSAYKGGLNTASVYWGLPTEVPDGESVLIIVGPYTVHTTVELPEDGVYDLTFKSCGRNHTKIGQIYDLKIGPDAENLQTFGRLQVKTASRHFFGNRFRMPQLAKGSYQFYIVPVTEGLPTTDTATMIDDVRLTRVADDDVYEIPNGDFETFDADYATMVPGTSSYYTFSTNICNRLENWIVHQAVRAEASKETLYTGSAPVMPNLIRPGANSSWPGAFYDSRPGNDGSVQLYLSLGGSAENTFTPPAGTYYIRADVSMRVQTTSSAEYMIPSASVKLAGSDETIKLGEVGLDRTFDMKTVTFANPFTVDGKTAVTLTLTANKHYTKNQTEGHVLFDNVKLVPADRMVYDKTNLVKNPTFDTNTNSWTLVNTQGKGVNYAPHRREPHEGFGGDWYAGTAALCMIDRGTAAQDIEFPAAGRYRLSFLVRRRVGWAKEFDPVKFLLAADGVTNEIAQLTACASSNFVERTYAFNVPTAGTRRFVIKGLGDSEEYPGDDMNTLIDNISIVREQAALSAPSVPATAEIRVEKGAELRLDYPGTVTVDRLRYGGVSLSGVVSAATHPEFVSGDGAIVIDSKKPLPGFTVIVQ